RISSFALKNLTVAVTSAAASGTATPSTRPNRQNRSIRWHMSVHLVQKEKLKTVHRRQTRLSHRPCHDRYEDRRHLNGKRELSWVWLRCHVPPPGSGTRSK